MKNLLLKNLIKEIIYELNMNASQIELNSKINMDLKNYKTNKILNKSEENENESILDINNDNINYIDFNRQQKQKRKHT